MNIIELKNISKWYVENDGSKTVVFERLNLSIEEGEFVCVVGESGSGKTTLMNIIGTVDNVNEGEVIISGVDVTKLNEEELANLRNKKIGFVFQHHFLLRGFSVLENIIIPSIIAGEKVSALERGKKLMEILKISGKENRSIEQISGGERQRVAIARALINNPDIIIADEPTGNLDPRNAQIVFDVFYEAVRMFNKTCIVATHNTELAKKADRIIDVEKIKYT